MVGACGGDPVASSGPQEGDAASDARAQNDAPSPSDRIESAERTYDALDSSGDRGSVDASAPPDGDAADASLVNDSAPDAADAIGSETGDDFDSDAGGADAPVEPGFEGGDAPAFSDAGTSDDSADASASDDSADASASDDSADASTSDDSADASTSDAGLDSNGIDAGGDADGDDAGSFDNPSCVGLPANCGPTSGQSCCRRAPIAGGAYLRSYDGVTFTNASYGATVSSFVLDTFEVTVGRFRAFVQAGFGTQANPPSAGAGALGGTPASGWNSGDNDNFAPDTASLRSALSCSANYQTWTDAPSTNDNRPMNCVTWYEAFAFCIWDGARLPSEAEWNYAAAGGAEQRVYPWSSPPSATSISDSNASYWVDATKTCFGDGISGCAITDLIVVGSKAAGLGRWGHADLGGNVWEWTRDTFSNPYKTTSCNDCVDLTKGTMKVTRGGSFFGTSSTLVASGRSEGAAATRYYTVGIRCAR
jgi:formylglycine-generating enzyme required for sulfatase activity